MMDGEPLSAQELRNLFVSLLKASYEKQILDGELAAQHVLAVALEQSLEFTAKAVDTDDDEDDKEEVAESQNLFF